MASRGRRKVILLGIAVGAVLLAGDALWQERPIPTSPPTLIFHDHLAASASGRPSLPDRAQGKVHYPVLNLATNLPAARLQGTVYALDPTLGPTPEQVARVWGETDLPSVVDNITQIGPIQYFQSSGVIFYSRPGNPQSVRVPGPGLFPRAITSSNSAITMARDFIVSRGLFSRNDVDAMRATAERTTVGVDVPLWTVVLTRMLDGAQDQGSVTPGAELRVADNGRIDDILIEHRSISGSEKASMIDSAEAWRQITLGHWYTTDLILNTTTSNQPAFVADQAELCYHEEDPVAPQAAAQLWLVPMWCFADTKTAPGFTVRLYYPALAPGTFDWKVPTH